MYCIYFAIAVTTYQNGRYNFEHTNTIVVFHMLHILWMCTRILSFELCWYVQCSMLMLVDAYVKLCKSWSTIIIQTSFAAQWILKLQWHYRLTSLQVSKQRWFSRWKSLVNVLWMFTNKVVWKAGRYALKQREMCNKPTLQSTPNLPRLVGFVCRFKLVLRADMSSVPLPPP